MIRNRPIYTGKPFFAFILILISASSLLLYLSLTTHGKFVSEDTNIVVENCLIKEWKHFSKIFTQDYFAISGEVGYRPIVTISYFIDYAVWHLNPFGFHLTNVIAHTINTVLFYLFLRTVIRSSTIILLSTFFFVTHPILVETVKAIAYRGYLLSATFLLVSLIYFVKSDTLLYKETNQKKRVRLYYFISLAAYFCALFSKEIAITLPILLMLLAMFPDKTKGHEPPPKFDNGHGKEKSPGQKIWPAMIKRLKGIYIGYFIISAFYLLIWFAVFSNHTSTAVHQPACFWLNTLTMIKVLASYIKLSFFPFNFNVNYAVPPVKSPLEISFILSAVLLLSILTIFIFLCRWRNIIAYWIAWFFIVLLPAANIFPGGNIMSHFYIPVMGFCVIKGILIYRITDITLSARALPLRRVVQMVLIILTIGGSGFSIIWRN